MKTRIIPILLCAALLLTLPVQAAVLGERVDGYSTALARGVTLTRTSYWTGSDYRSENYLTISPGSAAVPVAVSGDPLWAQQSLAAAAGRLEQQGRHVLGGSNGGYYTVATGEPVGLVASGGVLRADDQGLPAFGFRSDGSAIYGKPAVRLRLGDGTQTVAVAALNHAAGPGLRLYTADCAGSVKSYGKSWSVLCAAAELPGLAGSVQIIVESVGELDGSIKLPAGRLLLLLPKEANGAAQTLPEFIREGTALQLESRCAPGWEDVDSAVGVLYPLVENGAVLPNLEPYAAPRSAIGLKEDGSLVLYTIDGRQSGHSVGAGLSTVAQRMQELGCVSAATLDGGGSTQLAAQLPGESGLTTQNKPSDGSARRVVNYILLATPDTAADAAALLALYPLRINAVAGARIPLTVKAVDENGRPAQTPGRLSYTVSGGLGRVENGVFYATGNGSGSITVSAPGVESATIPLRVAASPEKLEFYGEKYGKLTTSLTLEPGQAVDLTVRATDGHIQLSGDDSCYTWTLDPAAGTVDGTGHLIPGDASGSGMLTASIGGSSVSIPITIQSGIPFQDVGRSDPYFNAVKYVYEHGIFAGTSETGFSPNVVMNRGMLVTVLWRMCGKPAAAAPAAFGDVAADAWYGPAVAWAAETGLVKGYSDTVFAPEDDLTMEQILTILHRWAGLPAASADGADLRGASDYALPALRWALARKLLDPKPGTPLQPQGAMSRAAVAEVLMRWDQLPKETN